ELEGLIGLESRVTVLGHIQRGGSPNTYDRILATRYGVAAMDAALEKDYGKMTALKGADIVRVPLCEAIKKLKMIQSDDAVLLTARKLGLRFGD
ncbi:MAG: 6-phosphofructokinase, partial [Eubacteriales bacterium]